MEPYGALIWSPFEEAFKGLSKAKPSPLERFEEVFKAINDDDDKAISLDEFKEGKSATTIKAL